MVVDVPSQLAHFHGVVAVADAQGGLYSTGHSVVALLQSVPSAEWRSGWGADRDSPNGVFDGKDLRRETSKP